MPTIRNADLTLTPVSVGSIPAIRIEVTYDADFTPFERQLAGLGLNFHSHINIVGMDPTIADPFAGTVIESFENVDFPVTAGAGTQTIGRSQSILIIRNSLFEDAAPGDNDEIRCTIRVHTQDIPLEFTDEVFTEQEILVK